MGKPLVYQKVSVSKNPHSLTVGPGPEALPVWYCFSHLRNEMWLIFLGAIYEF